MAESIVVVCPGRGSYTKTELGSLQGRGPEVERLVNELDRLRVAQGQPTLSELDRAPAFSPARHTPGENASALIFACSLVDFWSIDRQRYQIAAVTGNSMGWYTALAVGGGVDTYGGFEVVNTMGSMMRDGVIGGQLIYPVVDLETWHLDPTLKATVDATLAEVNQEPDCQLFVSIRLGGYVVLAGNDAGLRAAQKRLPRIEERYPFKLVNHGAFHSPLLADISQKGFAKLGPALFHKPEFPLVDGRGHIWQPFSTDHEQLRDYTLGHQVTETYDFSKAIRTCLKEFAPDRLVLLGPGASLGGVIGQIIVAEQWLGIRNKAEFKRLQEEDPFLLVDQAWARSRSLSLSSRG